jgi:hypothetical protein
VGQLTGMTAAALGSGFKSGHLEVSTTFFCNRARAAEGLNFFFIGYWELNTNNLNCQGQRRKKKIFFSTAVALAFSLSSSFEI